MNPAQMIDNELRGKVVLACGVTKGPMRTAALLFGAEGAWVAVVYRSDIAGAKSLVDEIRAAGGRALPTPGDVRTEEGAWRIARFVESEWAQIDVVLFATPVVGKDERAEDVVPLFRQVSAGMRDRGWGRLVLVGSHACGDGAPTLDPVVASPGVLANTLLLPQETYIEQLKEVAAWTALFLGSGWNRQTTGVSVKIAESSIGP